MTTPTDGLHSGIGERDYHEDRGSLSVSGAKALRQSPALYRHRLDVPWTKPEFDFGSAAHAIVLGAGVDDIYVAPFDNWRSKAAQDERKLAHADRLSPVLPADWERACDMAEALDRHTVASELLALAGESEVSAYRTDAETGVRLRGRFDRLTEKIGIDYKTTTKTIPDAKFDRDAYDYGYYMQDAWYCDLAAAVGHGLTAFAFIVQSKNPPYLVAVVELDDAARDLGRRHNREAVDLYAACRAADEWPGPSGYRTVSLPAYAFRKDPA